MFCKHCGKQLNEDSLFCTQCGQKNEASQSYATAQQERYSTENFAHAKQNYLSRLVDTQKHDFEPKRKLSKKTTKILVITLPIVGALFLGLIVAFPLTAFIKSQISIIAYAAARELIKENMNAVTDMAHKAAKEVMAEYVPVIANDIATKIVAENMENVPDIVIEEAGKLIREYDIKQATREKERTLVVTDKELSTNSFFGDDRYWWSFTVPSGLHGVTIECRSSYGLETAFLTRTEDDANQFYRGYGYNYVSGTVQDNRKTYYYEIVLPPGTYYFCVRGKTALYKIAANYVQVKIVAKTQS